MAHREKLNYKPSLVFVCRQGGDSESAGSSTPTSERSRSCHLALEVIRLRETSAPQDRGQSHLQVGPGPAELTEAKDGEVVGGVLGGYRVSVMN